MSQADKAGPTTTAIAVATCILAALGGYFIGQASSAGLFKSSQRRVKSGSAEKDADSGSESGSEPEPEDEVQDDLKGFETDHDECKLVLVVRTDLGMTKGKIAAQAGHATLACYKALAHSTSPTMTALLRRWERGGQAKIAVQCRSEEEMELLHAQAMSLGLCARVIHDAGRTQIAAGSATVLGIGPAPKGRIDEVTGGLKLL